MKRKDMIRHLKQHNCYLLREGKKHSIYYNPDNGKEAPVPRHRELKNVICKAIVKSLKLM